MFSFKWPPGLLFLAQTAHFWMLPPLLVLLVHQYTSLELPTSIWITAYLLAAPAPHLVKGVLQYFMEEREIKRLGARRLPVVPSKWPGALDLLYVMVESFNNGYIGMTLSFWIATGHPICTIRGRMG